MFESRRYSSSMTPYHLKRYQNLSLREELPDRKNTDMLSQKKMSDKEIVIFRRIRINFTSDWTRELIWIIQNITKLHKEKVDSSSLLFLTCTRFNRCVVDYILSHKCACWPPTCSSCQAVEEKSRDLTCPPWATSRGSSSPLSTPRISRVGSFFSVPHHTLATAELRRHSHHSADSMKNTSYRMINECK